MILQNDMVEAVASHLRLEPASELAGDVSLPGDKSISHRALMLGSIAKGKTKISGCLMGADCVATLQAMRQLGVTIHQLSETELVVHGVGLKGLTLPSAPLDLGNSGTAMRLLAGLLAGANITATLTGDASLCSRPMLRVVNPLRQMGATIQLTEEDRAPLHLQSHRPLTAIDYPMPVASAQVKSAILLAALSAEGMTSVIEPAITRDHTERMLQTMGMPLNRVGQRIQLDPSRGKLVGKNIIVPGDISSAAFFMVAASIAAKAEVCLRQVGINPTRRGIIDILQLMGANIRLINQRQFGEEPVADIVITPAPLKGIKIPVNLVPLAIDEFPVIFIAAACAEGQTLLQGAEELRLKESDRIQSMAEGLAILGIDATPLADGIRITGGPLSGGVIDSYGDHRIAMAFAVASLRANDNITIKNCANIATSFPNFVALSRALGLTIIEEDSL